MKSRKKTSIIKTINSYFFDIKHKNSRNNTVITINLSLAVLFIVCFVIPDGYLTQYISNHILKPYVGITYILLVPFLLYSSFIRIFDKHFYTKFEFFLGGSIFIITASLLVTLSAGDLYGGSFWVWVLNLQSEFLGIILYILVPILFLVSLVMLRVVNLRRIHDWVLEKERKIYNDEEGEQYDEDEEEYDEDNEEYLEEDNEECLEEEVEEEEGEEEKEKREKVEKKIPATKRKRVGEYIYPTIKLLEATKGKGVAGDTRENVHRIKNTFANFNIEVEVESVNVGPTFTRYSLKPAEGVRLQKIISLQNNLELSLAAHPIRIEAPIPGKSLVGIEVPNSSRAIIGLKSLMDTEDFEKESAGLPLIIGKTINGKLLIKSLAKMPHCLIAGTTGSGKSVLIHNIVLSLIFKYSPEELKFIFIDPKRVELTLYEGIPHLYADPITNPKKALAALVWVVNEMERRYSLLEKEKVRDIDSYNTKIENEEDTNHMPKLVIVIDELADLMQQYPREIESNIVRIAQKSRAVGIHLILSTQRPSVNIITGVVKANIPVRIALQVASAIDSRTILDSMGAESLIGGGDLLFSSNEHKKPIRAQSAFVTEKEVKDVVKFLITKNGHAELFEDITSMQKSKNILNSDNSNETDDELFEEARQIVIENKRASTSLLQRKLKIGYSRAARLIDLLEDAGIVGPANGSRPREILEE